MAGDQAITPTNQLPTVEPTVAIHPTTPSKIIVGALRPNANLMIFYTTNGGEKWDQAILPEVRKEDWQHSDACLAWNSQNRVWALAIGVMGPVNDATLRLYAFYSDNAGKDWCFDKVVSGDQVKADRPSICIDRSSACPDRVYAGWTCGNQYFVAYRGPNPGDTWSDPQQVSQNGTGITEAVGGDVKVTHDGRVFVMWPAFKDAPLNPSSPPEPIELYSAISDDAVNYSSPHHVVTLKAATPFGATGGEETVSIPIPAMLRRGASIATFAEVSAVSDGTVFAVWNDLASSNAETPNGPGEDVDSDAVSRVWFGKSTSSGTTWDTIKQLSDVASKSDQFQPRIARDPLTGALAVAWYDTGEDPNRVATHVVMKVSTDEGENFGPAQTLTSAPTNEAAKGSQKRYQFGDYLGLAAQNGTFACVWTDRRNTKETERIWIRFARIADDALQTPSSIALPLHSPSDWVSVSGYAPSGSEKHGDLVFETAGDGDLYAAVAGKLTVHYPGLLTREGNIPLPDPLGSEPIPATVSLYLHPNAVTLENAFTTVARQFGGLSGFKYSNIDSAALIAALKSYLENPINTIGGGRLPDQVIVELLKGQRGGLKVRAGTRIGKASTENASTGTRRFAFTVLNDAGPIDPAFVYSTLANFVIDGPDALHDFLQGRATPPQPALAPVNWPPFAADASRESILAATAGSLYSMAALETLRPPNHASVDAYTWREIGNGQKTQWLGRLRARVGRPIGTEQYPPFDFDDTDQRNVFQLEAVVEFYANFDDPWLPSVQRNSGDAGYLTVDFLDPAGTDATSLTPGSNVVTLNPVGTSQTAQQITDLLTETVHYNIVNSGSEIRDVLVLDDDTSTTRTSRTYRITDIDTGLRQVTLDSPPVLNGVPSRWTIRRRPVLVIVDPLGPRAGLRGGKQATVFAGGAVGEIALDGSPSLGRVTRYHDTFHFSGDQAQTSATHPISKTYRVQTFDDGTKHVVVDASPDLGAGSPWVSPAGVGGVLDGGSDLLTRSDTAFGFDHYDGALFIVHASAIQAPSWPWSSYTSWESLNAVLHPGVSIRGNRKYVFSSYLSTTASDDPKKIASAAFKNYCFRVVDTGLPYAGNTSVYGDTDNIAQSRSYFQRLPGHDVANNVGGMSQIRLHAGNRQGTNGTGSKGCLVSHEHGHMRARLIALYKAEHLAAYGQADVRFDALENVVTTQGGIDYWNQTQLTAWNSLIVGQLWLIRPDERPTTV